MTGSRSGGVVMEDRQYQIGIISSSFSLVEKFQEIAEKQGQNINVSYEGQNEAINVGKNMEADGVEVIISRRGTAYMLRENLKIPVLSIPQASIDVIKGLKKASEWGDKIILTVFMNKITGVDTLEELLNVQIHQGIYNDIQSMESVIRSAINHGCNVAVGGSRTSLLSKKYGLKCVELETNKEVIIEIFENAKSAAQARREEQKKTFRYYSILDATTEGIIAVDNENRIDAINQAAKKFLGINSDSKLTGQLISLFVTHEPLLKILKADKAIWDRIEKVNDEIFMFNHMPMKMMNEFIGGVSTFKPISTVMEAESVIRRSLAKGLVAKYSIGDLIHKSSVMRNLIIKSKKFARTESTILIEGETGTGKEILSHSIHKLSRRVKSPFVSVHCGALPKQLLESELFGYEEGAFTGSKKGGNPGRFEVAHNGTIFLDEIDTTSLSVQTRLLRVLQEKEVTRLGGSRKIPVDVRIIAAASKDLGFAVKEKKFREDLYFRLNVLRICIPPLRDRREDIPVLLDYFIRKFSNENRVAPIALPQFYISRLMDYFWPGNVRQLCNFSERLVLNCSLDCTTEAMDELYQELISYLPDSLPAPSEQKNESLKQQIKANKLNQELTIIMNSLEKQKFNKTQTAKSLGISRSTLWRKLKEAGIENQ